MVHNMWKMTHYSIERGDHILVKEYEFLSFTKNFGKDLNGKYIQILLDHAKQSATDAFETTSKKAIQKAVAATSNSIGNKIVNAVAKSYYDKMYFIVM